MVVSVVIDAFWRNDRCVVLQVATFSLLVPQRITAAIWIMADTFTPSDHSWPGVAMMLQSLCIFMASMILLWGRAGGSSEYDAF